MADIVKMFAGVLRNLPAEEQMLFGKLITPQFTQQLGAINPAMGEEISIFAQAQQAKGSKGVQQAPAPQAVAPAPVQAPAPAPAPVRAPTPAPVPQAAPVQRKENFADGGVIERGQSPADPATPPGPTGRTDDLKRNVSEGEVVVPADVVKAKGVDFFDKLKTSVREAMAKRKEEEAAQAAAKQGGPTAPLSVPPAPPGNVQPTTSGPVAMPQGTGSARRPIL